MIVLWTLILAPFIVIGVLPLGPILGLTGLWFLGSGIKACRDDKRYTDLVIIDVILYFVPGIVLLWGGVFVGNRGLLELLF